MLQGKGALWQGDVGSTGLNKQKPASLLQEFPDCNVFMWGVHHQEERAHTAFLQCGLGTLICLLIYSVVLALYPEGHSEVLLGSVNSKGVASRLSEILMLLISIWTTGSRSNQ